MAFARILEGLQTQSLKILHVPLAKPHCLLALLPLRTFLLAPMSACFGLPLSILRLW